MGKRRRERDRPKELPGTYNPNKRVLLSYASDEDDVPAAIAEPVGTGRPEVAAAIDNYQIAPYGDDDDVDDKDATVLQDDGTAAKVEEDLPVESKAKKENKNWSKPVTKSHELTGQWPALGSLSYQYDGEYDDGEVDEEYDSTEEEAMAYLRAVRSERQNLPAIIRAPNVEDDAETDTRGYVKDGTYVGRPTIGPEMPAAARQTLDPREVYTDALRARFKRQRKVLRVQPAEERDATHVDELPAYFPPNDSKAHATWLRLLKTTLPATSHLRRFDQDTTFRLLELVQSRCLVREQEVSKSISAWIWALLSRLEDVGTMSNEEVFRIREFGKRAVLVQLLLSDPASAKLLEGDSDESVDIRNEDEIKLDDEDNVADAPDAVQPTDSEAKGTTSERVETLATFDMVIAIVGDVFGQRDLLEFRRDWEPLEEDSIDVP